MLMKFGFPDVDVWSSLPKLDTPIPPSPFKSEALCKFYNFTMKGSTPLSIAIIYFTSIHYMNEVVRKRQLRKRQANEEKSRNGGGGASGASGGATLSKSLPAAPWPIARTFPFKLFVLLHNIFLCIYSIWTFIGITTAIASTMDIFRFDLIPKFFQNINNENYTFAKLDVFFQSICDSRYGIFSRLITSSKGLHNLEILGYWFYISKFYEVLDTIVILVKGRPSSLLQSYHHAGAMMCMWAGVRYQSPPIWIFVVFNSFIHSLMYFYFTLSCLHIRVPTLAKKILTSLQITQFVVGGSIAILHCFVWISDLSLGDKIEEIRLISCIASPNQALPILINVAYLTPLTALFAIFYVESYFKKKT
ncbi:hypothetical protein KGF56_002153 [Candida oxycetoniae]|uniref:Elongation of fatty acids protein n=1 Tax=Candida oxycetoniae TaxID=497107 RepID=A0AAI9SXT8_9ASCO|nr:uncharacterized protein KGF56_002153 [Candida oxycetoniae]KAI3405068.1 hypothetical protein KGF56_002153 [Candida oxycetoniae]